MSKIYLNSTLSFYLSKIAERGRIMSAFRLVLVMAALLTVGVAKGQPLLGWQLFGAAGNEVSIGSTTTNGNLFTSFLTRGSGINAQALPNLFNATGFRTTSTTQAAAQTAQEYFEFTVRPQVGFTASLSNMSYRLRRSSAGPIRSIWRYSIDGTNFFDIPATLWNYTGTTSAGDPNPSAPIILSGITDLQNIPNSVTVTFRLYAWGATATTGLFGIGRSATAGATDFSLQINGTTSAGGPTINVTPATLTANDYVFSFGPSSPAKVFAVSGSNLTGAPGNLTVTAPTDYEMSVDNFVTAPVTSINVPYTTATLASTNVWVRLKAGLAVNTYNGQLVTISGGGATTKTVNCDGQVTPFFSSLADVVAVAASESATISSLQNDNAPLTSLTGVKVWEFTIRDGGAAGTDPDPLPTIVNSITFATAAGNQVSNWQQAIKTVSLFDGASLIATGVVTATQIQFTGMSYSVPDNGSKTLTVRLSLNCGIGGANTDGDDFGFSLSSANFTTASNLTSSQKSAFAAATSLNGANVIAVVATRLVYTQQPSSVVAVNNNFSPSVIVTATDACGNKDINFASAISITSTGTLLSSPQTATAVAGVASFPGIIHTAAGGPFTITATSGVLTPITSNTFTVSNSTLLNAGDLMLIGYDNYITDGTDMLSFVTFVPLLPNTPFTLANMVYDWKAPANVRQDRWYDGNNTNAYPAAIGTFNTLPPSVTLTYTGSTNISAGSIICVTINNAGGVVTAITIDGVSAYTNFTAINADGTNGKTVGSGVSLSTSNKDAVFLMQGTFFPIASPYYFTDGDGDRYRTFTGTVFGGLQTNESFQAFGVNGWNGGPRVSRIHPAIECVSISTGISANNQAHGFYKIASLHNDTHRNLIASIANLANWTTATGAASTTGDDLSGNNTCSAANRFTVTTNVAPGTWKGTTSTDWFDCKNWDDFNVPTTNTDVLITTAASNNAAIDNLSVKAGQFGNAASAKSVTILGRQLYIRNTGSVARNTLNLAGNMNINVANGLIMSDGLGGTTDGLINIGGNWTNNFSNGFLAGESEINFNSALAAQTVNVPDGETFFNFTNNNTNGGVALANNAATVNISNVLGLNSTSLSINNNTLVLSGTVAGAGSLLGNTTSNLTLTGSLAGSVGTINFAPGGQILNNLILNRTGAGASFTLGSTLAVNGLLTISAGILDAATNTLNGTGGLTMTAGELQLGKIAATLPELSGAYALTGGVVNFKGTGSQTIRGINYFNLTSSSTGARVFSNIGTVGIANSFTKGTNAYTFTGSTIDYNGTGAQSIVPFTAAVTPGSTYDNLKLSNAGTKAMAGNVDVESDLMINNSVTLSLGNNFLTLKSTATKTARVAPVSSTANIVYGTGRFVVERYFPGRRAWRLVTAPVTVDASKTIFNSWQLGQNNTVSGSGTYVTGPNEAANGLDVSPQHNYSLKRFNQTNSQFDGIGNTKGANLISGTSGTIGIPDNVGFFIFVRGDRTAANVNAFNPLGAVNSTTLRDTGRIQTDTYIFSANPSTGTHRYTLVGNPYASPVDFSGLTRNNVANKFQAWDPGLNSVGGYATVDLQLGPPGVVVPVGSTQTQTIQSKQAFLIETTNSSSPSIIFGESAKSASNNLTLFRPTTGDAVPSLSMNLLTVDADGNTTLADGVLMQFRDDFSSAVDVLDGIKLGNINETFSIQEGNDFLMLNRRPMPKQSDSILFSLRKVRALKYRFELQCKDINGHNLTGYLVDRFLDTYTALNMNGATSVDFNVVAGNAASVAANRFYIVFKKAFKFNPIHAEVVTKDVQVSWTVEDEAGVDKYEVERSVDGIHFTSIGSVFAKGGTSGTVAYMLVDNAPAAGEYFYRVKGIATSQATAYTESVKVKIAVTRNQLYVYPNPVKGGMIALQANALPAGTYAVRLLNNGGQVLVSNQLVHAAGTATEYVKYPAAIPTGSYQLEMVNKEGKKYLVSVVVEP